MADDNLKPVAGSEPPPANPIAKPRASTLKLKPVIRKPTIGATGITKPAIRPGLKLPTQTAAAKSSPAEVSAEKPQGGGAMEQLKSVTQKLKGVTQEIPQQAILRKTGIIADLDITEAQKQASKSRTARISLSDALGVAPVQNEAAPIKTIRIKRPDAIAKPATPAPAAPAAAAPAPAAEPVAENPAEPAAAAPSPTLTQRKTLKIARPGAVRPSGKFGIKKPGASAPAPAAAAAPAGEGGDVADIPDIPDMPAAAPAAPAAAAPMPANAVPSLSKGVTITGIIFQIAACVVVGALAYFLYLDAQLPLFCGGCGWGQ